MNIYIIGFMGTGKSTVARKLAKLTGGHLKDTDAYIEDREKMTTTEIFVAEGEDYFRRLESQALRELAARDDLIVSCGGGIVLREENTEIMKDSGRVFLLRAKPATIIERLKKDRSRPLLQRDDKEKVIQDMMAAREAKYLEAADVVIDVDGRRPEDLAKEIIEHIKKV